jgi:DNA replication initiation complex subunit (GINS family)
MAFKDDINYEKISQIYKKERKSSKLIDLNKDFYEVLISHLKELQEEYNKKHMNSHTSTEALLLNNEICKLDGIIKEIYTRRERKVLLSALDLGSASESDKMLDHEKQLYSSVVEMLKGFRDEVLDQKPKPVCDRLESADLKSNEQYKGITHAGDNDLKSSAEIEPDIDSPITTELNENIQDNEEPKNKLDKQDLENSAESIESSIETPEKEVTTETVLVQVLEDVEPFVGYVNSEMITYDLQKEDLVTIPKEYAEILKKGKKVSYVNGIL